MKKLQKKLLLYPSLIATTLLSGISAAACQGKKQQDNQKSNPAKPASKTNSDSNAQNNTVNNEKELTSQDPSFASWTLNLNNALKISAEVNENIINLINGKKLFYSFSKNALVVSENRPSRNEWSSAKTVFEFKNTPPKFFNIASPDINQGDKNNDEIKYQITDDEIILSYKSSKYIKGQNPLISTQVYQTKFVRDNSTLGIKDNETKQTNHSVNSSANNNDNTDANTTTTGEEKSVAVRKTKDGVYENLVAPSIKTAKSIKYVESNFYQSLEGKSGQELINALINLQKMHRDTTGNYNDLYATYRNSFVDKYYEKDNSLMDIYEEDPQGNDPHIYGFNNTGGSGYEGKGWNREHLVAQSWFSKASPMRNDAHHVWPTDATVNQAHGNYPYGEVSRATFTSENGTKVGTSVEDGQPVTEVINEFKGDVARAFLYFAITYQDKNITNNESSNRFFDSRNGNSIRKPFLDTMLRWSKLDPITQFDLDRNNGIYQHQQNRNPFSDYPELIDVVFNGDTEYVFHNHGFATELVFE
ncbi:endonuclease [Mycoplasma sp. HS2188]|uniref:endonuclease n=1 Tax=Mycoplasma sp. HS2188 TaxID=2976765 RepID=UPI0021A9859C|nr:endonuclease [Mycoplasma sp. HS2188]MCT4469723.1 endonuclease [Mycoplasma sp. HS2188]